ncbi:peptidylprolyl isomerase [Oculatella sp. LEGE 06141]|uniref:peptidylprolyl isomerase n=1 Tax=Oculatella sp. LEGE 06141 TaxID=1828648 RepID=UPI0018801CA0|nr:peptidylprolyl isomerase [Oculatella sp. LEGE 06141]MBE9181630.1 peptidylprolyl isomerase [Oculatella sp. LEGE 06141]
MIETFVANNRLFPDKSPATAEDILTYLKYSCQFAEIAASAERDAVILKLCAQFGVTVTEDEWQAAGDVFRLEHKLLGIAETQTWLAQQRMTVEEWSEGVRIALLTKKLKEHLFGTAIDGHYISNREEYKRVALSQILVLDLTDAFKIVQALREEKDSFCSLALSYSKGKQSQENGGFAGIHFLAELMPELVQAISAATEGDVVGPIHTRLGYHILRVEKWYPTELTDSVRDQILESLFQEWLEASADD